MLVDARLVSSDEVDGETQLAATHEALFTAWPQLADAIASRAERLQLRRRLEQAAAEWERVDHDPSILWRGGPLRAARAALDDGGGWSTSEREFVEASFAADLESRRREADILADRIRSSPLLERDSELALLLLLFAADRFAVTDAVIGRLREALAIHRLIGRVRSPNAQMTALAISGNGGWIAAGDIGTNVLIRPSTRPQPLPSAAQCRLTLWRADPLELDREVWIDGRRVSGLMVEEGPAGVRLAAGVDSRVVVVNGEAGTVTHDVSIGSAARSLALAPDGNRLVAQRADGSMVAIDLIAGTVHDHVEEPDASAFARDDPTAKGWSGLPSSSFRAFATSARRAVLDDPHGIALYSLDPVDAPTPIGAVSGTVAALRWKPGGTRHAITTDGRCIDLATGDGQEPLGDVLAVTADGERLLLEGPLRLHSVTSQTARPLAVERRVVAAGFSEDGNRLAVATWGSLSVFDVGTGQLVTRFGEHDDEEGDLYQGIALNRDGTRLVTSSLGGGRAHVWDVDTGEVLGPVPRDLLDTSPDGADVIARGFRAIAADLSAGVEIRLGAPPGDVTMIRLAGPHGDGRRPCGLPRERGRSAAVRVLAPGLPSALRRCP